MKFFLPPNHPCMNKNSRAPADCFWVSCNSKDLDTLHTAFATPSYREIKVAHPDANKDSKAPKFRTRRVANERVLDARLWVMDVFDTFAGLLDCPVSQVVHAFKSYTPAAWGYLADRKLYEAWIKFDISRQARLVEQERSTSHHSARQDVMFTTFEDQAREAWTKALGVTHHIKDPGKEMSKFMASIDRRGQHISVAQAQKELENNYRANTDKLDRESDKRVETAIAYVNEQAAARTREARNE